MNEKLVAQTTDSIYRVLVDSSSLTRQEIIEVLRRVDERYRALPILRATPCAP